MSFPSQSQETQPLESQKERETRSTTLTLKEQEKVIDSLKKENFGLKLKIWFLERRLEEVSPDHIDNALKEKVILDLHSAMDILQNQKCTLPHGMTEEEHLQYDTMKMANQKYRSENDRLHQMVANISAENAKLRSSIRSQHPSRTTSPFSDFHDDSDPWTNKTSLRSSQVDLLRKEYYEAKQTIEEQNRTIRSLREEMMQRHSRSIEYGSNDHEIVKSILSDRDALVSKSEQLQKSNNDLQENRDIEKLRNNMDDLLQSLRESKKLVRIKTEECESLQQQLATQNQSPESEGLLDMLDQLRIENESLYMDAERADVLAQELAEFENLHQKEIARLEAEIEQREQECLVLEDEVDKVVAHAEELERQNQERNEQIRRLERKLRSASRLSHRSDDSNTELHRLEVEIQMRDEKIQQYEEQLDASAQLHKELERKNAQIIKYERQLQEAVHASEMHQNNLASLEEQFAEMEAALVQKDERIRDCENRVCEALEDAENAKHRYEEDLQTLEAEFQEVEQIIRERDVRIASLEDHLEAQTDAMQREKDIYEEDMRELENKYRMAAELIQEKDNLLADMEGRSATDGAYLKLKEVRRKRKNSLRIRLSDIPLPFDFRTDAMLL
ncbi:uncharacterized protein BYT42DRAFT_367332 [Radiomyces spectabilis]|uniref:uncharacterized protein n=1 Tax=Radiomyces spectabilis TaxID=64574 RepID=UPI00221EC3BB|nr:uncharacterized protein BYT42DRAFT_367332 [Radiomyces spectabilis]KAI8375914.1 hypothetical protein BYT42DRAFT_367332 [Radiomyces spectabilis]